LVYLLVLLIFRYLRMFGVRITVFLPQMHYYSKSLCQCKNDIPYK
jgi:hypothetical protein